MEERVNDFRSLLREYYETEHITITSNDFEEIKPLIRDDPRYEKIQREDRKFIFDKFVKDSKLQCFQQFRELLQESKNIGHISSKSSTSGPKFDNLKKLLSTDKRYVRLEPFAKDREKSMTDFIESLQKGGQ